jgi:outer membrane protein assembly factor BamB
MREIRRLLPVLLVLIAVPGFADDWSRFRGPNGSGTSTATGLPAEFGPEKNVIWTAEVPFGRSSPVIAGDRIFVSATEDGTFVTLALDRGTGKTIWKAVVEPTRKDEFHHDTDSATTTPVTDGSNVYVFFQEVGLLAFDKNGKERWRLPLGPFRNFYSIAASPLLAGNTLLMLCDQAEGSFLVAVDKNSGKQLWRANRPARLESYSTPVLYPADKPRSALVVGSRWVDAYDLKTGKSQWALGDVGTGPVSSPVLVGDVLYISAPNQGENGWPPFEPILKEHDADGNGELSREEVADAWLIKHFGWLDHDGNDSISAGDWSSLGNEMQNDNFGVYAVRLPTGDGKPEILWNYRKNIPEISSPVVHDGVLYMVQDGIVTSLNAETGELIKRDRMAEGSPKVYASPIVADGKVYLGTLEGEMVVIEAAGEWNKLSSVDLGDEIWASPAVAGGSLYVRTRGKLYNFGTAAK